MHGWQANKRHIYVWLLKIGLCPKNKSHPLGGWIFTLPTDKLYTATVDLHFDKPVEVSVLMCETKSDLELFNEAAAIQPMDEHPLRGTFEAADWNYTLKKPVNAPEKPIPRRQPCRMEAR